MSNVAGFYLGYYGVVVGVPLLVRLVAAVYFGCRRRRSDREVAAARAQTALALERLGVEVAVGTYNGQPMASVLLRGDGFQEQLAREAEARWDAMSPEEQATELAWEDEQTAMWLNWADEHKEGRTA